MRNMFKAISWINRACLIIMKLKEIHSLIWSGSCYFALNTSQDNAHDTHSYTIPIPLITWSYYHMHVNTTQTQFYVTRSEWSPAHLTDIVTCRYSIKEYFRLLVFVFGAPAKNPHEKVRCIRDLTQSNVHKSKLFFHHVHRVFLKWGLLWLFFHSNEIFYSSLWERSRDHINM